MVRWVFLSDGDVTVVPWFAFRIFYIHSPKVNSNGYEKDMFFVFRRYLQFMHSMPGIVSVNMLSRGCTFYINQGTK